MKRTVLIGFVMVGALLVWVIPHFSQPVVGEAAAMEAPHIGEGGVPQFQVDLSFPKIPAKWKMAFGSAVAVDADNNVWILSRPRTLAHPRIDSEAPDLTSTPAPPVMEFDNDGNFIRGWGGENGPGYQWPSNEHGITVDSKGFVWIVGNADGPNRNDNPAGLPNDNQVLKFTKEGKFVMAIGKSGQTGSNETDILKGPQGVHVYAKTNEVFVADGGNSRVMVYDADTGEFKRKWGAYGNKPLDMNARPVNPLAKELCPTCPFGGGVRQALQQFSGMHEVIVSSDGLVYVCDRGNKRIQVFTTDGKFIAEQFVGLDVFGEQSNGAAFSPDERFLYVGGTPAVYILNRRTLEVVGSFNGRVGDAPVNNHEIGADHKGNVFVARTESDGKSGGAGAFKFALKGYSPKTSCPPCQSTRNVFE